jgi:NADH-quinone oxidoreductase subunit H
VTPLTDNTIYRGIYHFIDGFGPAWLAYAVAGLVVMLLIINSLMVLAMVYVYMERRILARFQSRLGPNRVGPFGILQPVADAIKLITKEDIVPVAADRWVFNIAPIVMLIPTLLILAVIPFGKNMFLTDLNVGLLFVFAIGSIGNLAIFMAGWSSSNKYALFGAMRGIAALISYEIPLVLSVVGVLLLTGSMSLIQVVEAQRIPFILLQPLGFFLLMVGLSAEMNRSPFDLVEAESEIIAGYHTEYSGMKFGVFQLAEFGNVLVGSAIVTTLFLKGWEGPLLPSHLWFLIKVFFIAYIFIWIRATIPRLRIDQMLGFAWKYLFPLSLVNIFVTAILVYLWPSPTTGQLWIMAGINWVVAVVAIVIFARIVSLSEKSLGSSDLPIGKPVREGR